MVHQAKAVLLLLGLAAAVNAQFVTVGGQVPSSVQGGSSQGAQPETFLLVDNANGEQRVMGVMQRMESRGAPEAAAQVFGRIFGALRPPRLFDNGWLDQRLPAGPAPLQPLQALFGRRAGCPHRAAAAAAAAAGQADPASLMSYMASSRFGPDLLNALSQAAAQEQMASTEGDVQFGEMQEAKQDGGAEWVAGYASDASDASSDTLEGLRPGGIVLEEVSEAGVQAQPEDLPLVPANYSRDSDPIDWSLQREDGSLNLGMVVFLALAGACGAVWLTLLRSACAACRRRCRRASAPRVCAASPEKAGLLTPLEPEKPLGNAQDPALFSAVQVASEETVEGTYFIPRGTEYVTVAYVPLKGEA